MVEAYEVGARAGHAIRDVLQRMLSNSAFAVLIMTGEDQTPDAGVMRARQNVVHEAGLFQGRLGFERAVVLLEDASTQLPPAATFARIQLRLWSEDSTIPLMARAASTLWGDG